MGKSINVLRRSLRSINRKKKMTRLRKVLSSPTTKRQHKNGPLSLRSLSLLYGLLVLFSALAAAVYASARTSPNVENPFKTAHHISVSFQLYYPARLPEQLKVNPTSVDTIDQNVVSMRVDEGNGRVGRSIIITQRSVPPGYNITTFLTSMENRTTVKTENGLATIGAIDNGTTLLGSLVTKDGTWILVRASADVTVQDLEIVLKHLKSVTQ